MACYVDESDLWKCPKHPSKRRRIGICPTCLHERLVTLCPECAKTRPCPCCTTPVGSASSSSSSSSSFSIFPFSSDVNRVSNLIQNEPAFRKSRSLAVPFMRSLSKSKSVVENDPPVLPTQPRVSRSKINFWSVFKVGKNSKCELHDDVSSRSDISGITEDYSMMMRSRSVAVGSGRGFSPANTRRRGWYFPSPMKAFRQSKTSKLQVIERSPMYRG